MITNHEIVDTYLAYKHRRRVKGERLDNIMPLMPFYIMDACYQVYCKDIKDYPCRHRAKQAKNKMAEAFRKFNTDFFLAFNPDQTDYILDQMDEFCEYIHNSIVMLKSAVVNYFATLGDISKLPFEDKRVIASLLICNALAQSAQHMYGEVYRKGNMSKEVEPTIEVVKKASYDYSNLFPFAINVDITSSKQVMDMIDVLCKNIIKFLKEKDNEGSN